MPLKGIIGTDFPKVRDDIKQIEDPLGSGTQVMAVPKLDLDVAIVHVPYADELGNGNIAGAVWMDDDMAKTAKKTIITCEKIVELEDIRHLPGKAQLPIQTTDAVVKLPFGAHPTSTFDRYTFDALHMIAGKPVVDYDKCTGCAACAKACPRHIIELIPFKQERVLVVGCSNKEPARNVKQVCKVGCIGCKACQRILADLFEVKDNLAYLNYDNYTGEEDFEPVFAKCPAKALVYFGQPKPEYAAQLAQEEAAAAASN